MSATETKALESRRVALIGAFAPSLVNFRGPLIADLVERGHEVFALAPEMDLGTASRLEQLGASPVEISLERGSLNPASALRTTRNLALTLRSISPDIVIAYTIGPITLGASAARAVGARFVPLVTGLGYAFLGGRRPKRVMIRLAASFMYRRALKTAQIVLFQNADDEKDFRRLKILPRTVHSAVVSGSGVDLDHFAPVPVPDEPIFLMIARFLKDKGVIEYGEAAVRLKQAFPRARFQLAGWIDRSPDAIDEEALRSLIEGGIEHLGKLDDVRPAIAASQVYVLPSYREGTPRSVLEAMAMGRPIVTTDAPGCRETVIDGENGFLVQVGDSRSLEAAMRRFIEDRNLAALMGRESRLRAEARYDVHQVNRTIFDHVGL